MTEAQVDHVFTPARFPCGRVAPNRLMKAAMYEHAGEFRGSPPTDTHIGMYKNWGQGRWGMVITGNAQVDKNHLALGRDVVIPDSLDDASLQPFKDLADAIHGGPDGAVDPSDRALAIMQVSHAGRQTSNWFTGRRPWDDPPLAPSSVRLGARESGFLPLLFYYFMFSTPREMTIPEIDHLVDRFVLSAQLAHQAGFDGIQLHAGHGYLLSQFISEKSNQRTDEYGEKLHLLHRVTKEVRRSVPKDFIVGIKLNCGDFVDRQAAEQSDGRVLQYVQDIVGWGLIDFLEITGGDYENPAFAAPQSKRQAFFSQVSRKVLDSLPKGPETPLIALTGGFRTYTMINSAIANGHTEIVGVGRLSIQDPHVPIEMKAERHEYVPPPPSDFTVSFWDWIWDTIGKVTGVRVPLMLGANREICWYMMLLEDVASFAPVDCSGSGFGALVRSGGGVKIRPRKDRVIPS